MPNKIAADDILIFHFYLSKKTKLDFSCESSAYQRSHLKHQVLFSLKNNEKVFMNVVCCSRDWLFKGYYKLYLHLKVDNRSKKQELWHIKTTPFVFPLQISL